MLLISPHFPLCPGLRGCAADNWICYRYSEFDDLRQRLVDSFPHAKNALPALPPKSVICMFLWLLFPFVLPSHWLISIVMTDKFRPKFLESRRVGLEYFLK